MPLNILYIDHYAGSLDYGMEFRPYYLAREWVKLGHKVRIIGADFSHLRIKNPVVTRDFDTEIIDDIEYQWIKTTMYSGNGSKRALSMFQFCWKLWSQAQMLVDDFHPDVVISSSTYPLDTYPGQRIAKIAHCKLVHEIHDMWPVTLIARGMSKWNPFTVLMQISENSFCKHADIIVSLLPKAKDYLISHGMDSKKFSHVPNGVVISEWETAKKLRQPCRDLLIEFKKNGNFLICFFGSHTKSYALGNLIEAIHLVNNENIKALFVGQGDEKKKLIAQTKKLQMDKNILFFDAVTKQEIPDMLQFMDAIYVGARRNKMFKYGICMNKLFDGMMAGKPILYSVDAPNNYIIDYNCGINVPAENIDELANGIRKLYSLPKQELNTLGKNGHIAIINNFDYTILAKKFLDVISK